MFFVFPVAFTLNRLGQHYDIDPDDPAKWTTLVRGHWFWDLAFLNSNYHLEHHYFPGVPFYRLPALQRALTPFYQRRGFRWRRYGSWSTAGSFETRRRTPTGRAEAADALADAAVRRLPLPSARGAPWTSDSPTSTSSCGARSASSPRARSGRTSWRGTRRSTSRSELVPRLADLGLMGIQIPEDYGGAGMSAVDYCICIEELARVDPSVALTVAAHNGLCTAHIFMFGTEAQKQRFVVPLARGEKIGAWGLTEPTAGSDAGGTQTRAVRRRRRAGC